MEGALDYQGRFRVSRNSFFQVNRFLLDRLVEVALEGAEGETALDLYAGVGLFSLALARRFPGSDGGGIGLGRGAGSCSSTRSARAWRTCGRSEQTAEEYLQKLERAPDFVLLDPPRAGLGKAVVRRLAELRPRAGDDCLLRPGHPGARPGGADGGRVPRRADDAGGSVSADVSSGDGGAADYFTTTFTSLSGTVITLTTCLPVEERLHLFVGHGERFQLFLGRAERGVRCGCAACRSPAPRFRLRLPWPARDRTPARAGGRPGLRLPSSSQISCER